MASHYIHTDYEKQEEKQATNGRVSGSSRRFMPQRIQDKKA